MDQLAPCSPVFIAQPGSHLGIEQVVQHPVCTWGEKLAVVQIDHKPKLIQGGILVRRYQVFQIVLGHEMQKPGIQKRIPAILEISN
jgi:hypothetical protein